MSNPRFPYSKVAVIGRGGLLCNKHGSFQKFFFFEIFLQQSKFFYRLIR